MRLPTEPRTITVPAIMERPTPAPALPRIAIRPRRIWRPASSPAEPSIRIAPSRIPSRLPGYAAPRNEPVFPRIVINPPRISAPTESSTLIVPPVISAPSCGPTSPRMNRCPLDISRPSPWTWLRSPSTVSRSSPRVPCTRNSSPSSMVVLPMASRVRHAWPARLSRNISGRRTEPSTGIAVAARHVNVSDIVSTFPFGFGSLALGIRTETGQNVMQPDVKGPQLAAIISRGDRHDALAGLRSGADACRRGLPDGLEGQPVNHDLVDTANLRRQVGGHHPAQGRRKGGVRARPQRLVLAAHLRAGARDAAGKRQDHVANLAHDLHSRCRRGQCSRGIGPHQNQVAARHALARAEGLLAGELSVHHRHAPVSSSREPLGDLPAISEIAQPAPDIDGLLCDRNTVVAGSRGASHHALANPVHKGFLQRFAAEGEEQERRV